MSIAGLGVVGAHAALGGLSVAHGGLLALVVALELLHRKTRAFLYAVAPMLLYLILYDLSRYLPVAMRPAIHVATLHSWETAIFGGLPHQWLGSNPSVVLDLLAACAYNLHYYVPILFVVISWRKHPVDLKAFAWSFGFMNIATLFTQVLFPTAPPWYFQKYGLAAAHYGMAGDPAGLARVDTLFGMNYFHGLYGMSPVVFGAFPSMHSAWPVLFALYTRRWSPKLSAVFWLYAGWMWWAAVYLQHHYVVDVIAGAGYAWVAYRVFRQRSDVAVAELRDAA